MTSYKSIKYNFSGADLTDVLAAPTVSSITPNSSTEDNLPLASVVIAGTGFQSNSTVTLVGASGTSVACPSVVYNSSIQLTVTIPAGIAVNEDPWDVQVENPVSGQGDNLFAVDENPDFVTPAGTLGTIPDSLRSSYSLSPATATDPEGVTVTYALVAPGPAVSPGLSFDTTNAAITGTAAAVPADTTTTFRVRATAGPQTSERDFSITVKEPVQAYYTTAGAGSVTVPHTGSIKILAVAGGGSGGGVGHEGGGGGGGLVLHPSYSATAGSYNFYIGEGGTHSPASNGENTNFNSPSGALATDASILGAIGGGQGTTAPSADGGSGGGRSHSNGPGGAALQTNSPLISSDSTTYGFGNDGGSATYTNPAHPSGGGGGAAGAGQSTVSGNQPGNGGAGKDCSTDFGTAQGSPGGHFAGGGGGGCHSGGSGSSGGTGGGGAGVSHGNSNQGNAGVVNTGGGGGSGNAGGSGIIGVAY